MSGLHALDLIVLGCILLWIILALLYMGKRKNRQRRLWLLWSLLILQRM
ncbi:MAG: hypothetical protein ACLTIG_03665 [Roseburia hominis]